MSVLSQCCLFTAQNVPLFYASKKRRVTQEDVGNALDLAPTTIDRCLKGIGDPKTIKSVTEAANRLGYQRIDKWKSIKKEFIKGYDLIGRPILDEEAVCVLRKRGNHARSISGITGISKKRLNQIFKKNNAN